MNNIPLGKSGEKKAAAFLIEKAAEKLPKWKDSDEALPLMDGSSAETDYPSEAQNALCALA